MEKFARKKVALKIKEGMDSLRAGRGISAEQVKREMADFKRAIQLPVNYRLVYENHTIKVL
jgi:hypothetical protein